MVQRLDKVVFHIFFPAARTAWWGTNSSDTSFAMSQRTTLTLHFSQRGHDFPPLRPQLRVRCQLHRPPTIYPQTVGQQARDAARRKQLHDELVVDEEVTPRSLSFVLCKKTSCFGGSR